MSISTIIYVRSSSDCPLSADEQAVRLRAVAADSGWIVAKIFIDRPTTTKKDRDQRPGQMALMNAIRSGTVQKVLMCSIDRLGRSLIDLVGILETCRAAGVELYLHEQRVDTAGSNGMSSLFDVAKMMAYHLRQSRRDRILRGQAAARNANVHFGRPPMSLIKVEKVKQGLASGKGVREVARLAGISAASVSRIKSASAPRSS
jgi:DNA invertase Pin-like site-specific DNA recombinase